jgi:hypothetical protein
MVFTMNHAAAKTIIETTTPKAHLAANIIEPNPILLELVEFGEDEDSALR